MKKSILSFIALLLCLTLVLCACGQVATQQATRPTSTQPTTPTQPDSPDEPDPEIPHFSEMTYTRPDGEALLAALEACEASIDGEKEPLLEAIEVYVELLSDFLTNQRLAQIYYNLDLSDDKWETEFNFCNDFIVSIQSRQDAMLRKLASSPYREELESDDLFGENFFDDYDGESIWTEEFTALMEQELALQTDYYAIYAEATASGYVDEAGEKALGQLYVDMIKLRQKIAREAGYDNYCTYAYETNYKRQYTPEQTQEYVNLIAQELSPLYLELSSDEALIYGMYYLQEEEDTFAYVQNFADAAGGSISQCFQLMESHGLYNIEAADHKMDSSFELFLPDYMVPFIFVNPTGTNYDSLTFTHEFGHFCNDYLSEGAMPSIDVAEFFSQGLEYLSLCYTGSDLTKLQMYTSLGVYVEQALYADFELQVYSIPEDELSVDALRKVCANVLKKFGFDAFGVDDTLFVYVTHFYVSPQYVISYVVSNDAALQLYQMELLNPGSGLACYTENLDTTEDQLLSFLEQAGLDSPFADGRITDVKETFESVLK